MTFYTDDGALIIETYEDDPGGPYCEHCGQELDWEDCGQCEDGYSYHDCGEDCCCCLYPEPNVVCDLCDGNGGWHSCSNQACPGKRDDHAQPA